MTTGDHNYLFYLPISGRIPSAATGVPEIAAVRKHAFPSPKPGRGQGEG